MLEIVERTTAGQLIPGPQRCYDTIAAATASIGAPVETVSAGGSITTTTSADTFTIGVHYDGAGLSGSSVTVTGVDCLGGYLNLPLSWRNRVSSTMNGCPVIRHFESLTLTGDWEDTFSPSGALSTLDNKTDSIQYRPS